MRLESKKILSRLPSSFWFMLVCTAGIFLNFPYHNFMLQLSQGDHGNNFYAFQETFRGAMPYRDYWWVYGPLMPYYYALWFRFLGENMHSVLLGYQFLNILCGLVFYGIIRLYFPSFMACTAAIFYWVYCPHFPYTFNHIGGILMILFMLYFIFAYIRNPKLNFLYIALGSVLALSLVKYNFGVVMLAGLMLSVFVADRMLGIPFNREKQQFYFRAAILSPVMIVLIYAWFLHPLSWPEIRQCLPAFDTDPEHIPFQTAVRIAVSHIYRINYFLGIPIFNVLLILLGAYYVYLLAAGKIPPPLRKQILTGLIILIILGLLALHEFLPSGFLYRLLWIEPFRQIIMFFIIFTVLFTWPKPVQLYGCLYIVLLVAGIHLWRYQYLEPLRQHVPLERWQIDIGNDPEWLATVLRATSFMQQQLGPNETFLALPSDQLYYFLLGRKSPYRLTEYSMTMPLRQENELIETLKTKHVRYILISNRYRNPDTGQGEFGVAYGQRIGRYLRQHYEPIQGFGNWKGSAAWINTHAVVVLKLRQDDNGILYPINWLDPN